MGAEDSIGVPTWTQPPSLSSIEDRIDSALSSANGILNFALGVVRGFVHAVLHPLFAFADLTIGWVYQVIHWVFDHISNLANQARNAVARLWQDTVSLISRSVGDVAGAVGGVTSFVTRTVETAINTLTGTVRGWVNYLTSTARGWVDGPSRRAPPNRAGAELQVVHC
jgi:phage-related protein